MNRSGNFAGFSSYLDGSCRRGERVTLEGSRVPGVAKSARFDVLGEEQRISEVLPNLWKHTKRRAQGDAKIVAEPFSSKTAMYVAGKWPRHF